MNARVRQTGTLHAAAAVQQQKLPVVGKIRPGIKVPTAKARGVPGVIDAYTAGLKAGATYDDIALAIEKNQRLPCISSDAEELAVLSRASVRFCARAG